MRNYQGKAIVLCTHKLGEMDRIITLLTSEYGLVRAVAKGVCRTSSKFSSRAEPFGTVDVQITKGRSSDIVTQVEVISIHADALTLNLKLYTRASIMIETAEELTQDSDEGTRPRYLLFVGALFALSHVYRDPSLILTSYILRALAITGWAPPCFDCTVYGTQGPHSSFSIHEGRVVCRQCRPAGVMAPAPGTMTLTDELLSRDWMCADTAEGFARNEAHAFVSSYAQWHVEHRIRSLRVLERSR